MKQLEIYKMVKNKPPNLKKTCIFTNIFTSLKWSQTACNECVKNFFMINTHTHNHFTALLDFVRDYLGESAPER